MDNHHSVVFRIVEGDVPGDNEVDEGSLIISEDPDNESTV